MQEQGNYKRRKAFSGLPESRPHCETLLAQWLRSQGCSTPAFARLIGCNVRTARCWVNGQQLPGIVYAYKIDELTKGAVPPASWLATDIGREEWESCGKARHE